MPAFKKYYSKCHVITFNMPMPPLGVASRRIWVYLPPGYRETERRYPVIYMHDGQNLFDPDTSYCGEWYVGRSINALVKGGKHAGAIVIGIDNGGPTRPSEYSPWSGIDVDNPRGEDYVRFITDYLKPFIDINLRTLPDRANTAVAGSSAGGIISFYAALRRPEIFGLAGIFSPSFWYSWENVENYIRQSDLRAGMKIYLDIGTKEEDRPDAYLNAAKAASKLFKKKQGVNLKFVIDEGAPHHEDAWRRRFPDAFMWMFPPEKQ